MIVWKIIKNIAKKLIVASIVIAISISIMTVNQAAGIILMMLYSSWMIIKSSRKEMPLNKFTALLPGIMSLATFFIMLGLISVREEVMPLIGVGLGIIPGWLMARGHKVYKKNGVVYAKRTFLYIFIWVLSTLFTQGTTLIGFREITDFGFLLNGFSMALMVVLSLILFIKSTHSKNDTPNRNLSIASFFLALTIFLIIVPLKQLKATDFSANNESELTHEIGNYVFTDALFSQFKSKMIDYSVDRISYGPGHYEVQLLGNVVGPDGVSHNGSRAGNAAIRNILIPDTFEFSLIDKSLLQGGLRGVASLDVLVNKFQQFQSNGCNFSIDAFYQKISTSSGKGHMCYEYYGPVKQSIKLAWSDDRWIVRHESTFDWSNNEQVRQQQRAISKSTFNVVISKLLSINSKNYQPQPPHQPTPNPITNFEEFLNAIEQLLHDFGFSDPDAAAAGAAVAFIMLLGGLGLNAAIIAAQETANSVMTAGLDNSSSERDPDGPVLLDPDFGDPLIIHDGSYEGGKPGQVWYEGQWMDKDEAAQQIGIRQQEIDRDNRENEKYLDDFQKQNDQEWEQKMADRDQRLQDEHNIFDEDQQAWIKDPNHIPDTKPHTDLEEFYDRIDYVEDSIVKNLENNSEGMTSEQIESAEKILNKIKNRHEENPGEVSKQDLEDIQKLNNAMNNIRAGASQTEYADAEFTNDVLNNPLIKQGEKVAGALKWTGRMSAHLLEAKFSPHSRGSLTEFVYGFAENSDKSYSEALEHASISAASSWIDNKLGSLKKGNIAWNAGVGGTTSALEVALKGGSTDDIKNAFGTGTLFGGLFESLNNILGTGSFWGADSGNVVKIPKASNDPVNLFEGRTSNDIRLDMEYRQNKIETKHILNKFEDVIESGDRNSIRKATIEVLENRGSKLAMKGEGISVNTKNTFAEATQEFRTKPVFEGTTKELNSNNRYYVVENGAKRSVKADDFATGSGTPGKGPGVDFDMYAKNDIIDSKTNKSIQPDDLRKTVNKVTRDLGIDPNSTETNVMSKYHPEAYPVGNKTPKEFIDDAGKWNKNEGVTAKNVSDSKAGDADGVHGFNSANSLSEKCRGAVKDFERITLKMANADSNVKIPEIFNKIDPSTNKSVIDILKEVGNGEMSPGKGNFQVKALTGGKSLEELSSILNSLQEAIPVLKPS